ncbi:ABC transporter ATP-binding protein [Thermoactinomyces mirandus]|uniref:ABC transporter ATP-binding protein n=1 Tax=Thermoactinomyces mirandus TaxID=2756294 RepID=A0A7W2ARN2_9BACL|nr:ABC transporter ATP-binding protein [Thermoactinomyces mirandus]MBA4601775.1 ABC transporter ATP-binding protein [Thermoactinomyces mirandus]
MKPLLEIRNISKLIKGRKIIDDISLDVYPGEVFGLLGPNGAGKTTIIRMIAGLMAMDQGDIFIHGHSIKTQFEQAIQPVGAIVENPVLYPFLTGYQNLRHFARMVPDVDEQRIDEVVSQVKLDDRIHDAVKTYSLGMRQRLGLAQALLHQPSLLILDEPTNGLDPAGIHQLRDHLRNLAKKRGTAVLVSSHLLSEMQLMCDRFAIVQHGRLVALKPIREEQLQEDAELFVQFEVDQAEQIKPVFEELKWNKEVIPIPHGFQVSIKKEQIPELNACLIQKGVKVYGIKTVEKTLEDQYLEMTEGGCNG